MFLLVCVVAARGTLRSGPPLRWGDAYTTDSMFANHLGLNGTLTLANAASNYFSDHRDNSWKATLPADEARQVTRDLLLTPRDRLIDADQAAVRRIYTPPPEGQLPQLVEGRQQGRGRIVQWHDKKLDSTPESVNLFFQFSGRRPATLYHWHFSKVLLPAGRGSVLGWPFGVKECYGKS